MIVDLRVHEHQPTVDPLLHQLETHLPRSPLNSAPFESGKTLSDMPDTKPPPCAPDSAKEEPGDLLRHAYAVRLAFSLLTHDASPLARVVEHVHIALGSCRRDITFEWDLPPLTEAMPTRDPELRGFLMQYQERMDDLVIPLIPVRKGRILSKFDVQNSDGTTVYLCDRHEAKSYTRKMLTAAWTQFEDSLITDRTDAVQKELSYAGVTTSRSLSSKQRQRRGCSPMSPSAFTTSI